MLYSSVLLAIAYLSFRSNTQWAAAQELKIQELPPLDGSLSSHELRAEFLGPVRQRRTRTVVGMFVSGGIFLFLDPQSVWRYLAVIALSVSFLLQAQIFSRLENKVREIQLSRSDMTRFQGRVFLGSLFLQIIYYSCYIGLYLISAKILGRVFHGSSLMMISLGLALVVSAGVAQWVAPLAVRMMFPCKRVQDPETLAHLGQLFKKANVPTPTFWTIELEKFKFHNAMVTGSRWGFGPFRRALLYSKTLETLMTPDEFDAILYHEISHLALNHLIKRSRFLILAILTVFPLYLNLLMAGLIFLPKSYSTPVYASSLLLFVAYQLLISRPQVRYQEMEADAQAVAVYGASLQALGTGLEKLTALNHQSKKKRDPLHYLNPASAHPPTELRISLLQGRIEQHLLGKPMFQPGEMFHGWWNHSTQKGITAAGVLLLCGVFALGSYAIPTYQMRTAAFRGDIDTLKALHLKGYSQNGMDLWSVGDTPLIAASEANQVPTIQYLLDSGVDPNFENNFNYTALGAAYSRNSEQALRLLVERGGKMSTIFHSQNKPAILAAHKNHFAVLKFLVEHEKYNPSEERGDVKTTPLIEAASTGNLDMVQFLVEHGSSVNEVNQIKVSPLFLAVRGNHIQVAKYLMQKGANPRLQTILGTSALGIAQKWHSAVLLEILTTPSRSLADH